MAKPKIEITFQCIVKGCSEDGICLDRNNYTQQRAEMGLFDDDDFRAELLDGQPREIWYCREHALKYLHPMIDVACGNTSARILGDFYEEGLM